jgi:hypothetical protein
MDISIEPLKCIHVLKPRFFLEIDDYSKKL